MRTYLPRPTLTSRPRAQWRDVCGLMLWRRRVGGGGELRRSVVHGCECLASVHTAGSVLNLCDTSMTPLSLEIALRSLEMSIGDGRSGRRFYPTVTARNGRET